MRETQRSKVHCGQIEFDEKCGRVAAVVFKISGGELPRCAAHAAKMRGVLQRMVREDDWTEAAILSAPAAM